MELPGFLQGGRKCCVPAPRTLLPLSPSLSCPGKWIMLNGTISVQIYWDFVWFQDHHSGRLYPLRVGGYKVRRIKLNTLAEQKLVLEVAFQENENKTKQTTFWALC